LSHGHLILFVGVLEAHDVFFFQFRFICILSHIKIWGVTRSLSKLQSTCFVNLIIQRVLNVRKTKSVAKFDGVEPRRFEDIKGIVAPEIGPESFGFGRNSPRFNVSGREGLGTERHNFLVTVFFDCCCHSNILPNFSYN